MITSMFCDCNDFVYIWRPDLRLLDCLRHYLHISLVCVEILLLLLIDIIIINNIIIIYLFILVLGISAPSYTDNLLLCCQNIRDLYLQADFTFDAYRNDPNKRPGRLLHFSIFTWALI